MGFEISTPGEQRVKDRVSEGAAHSLFEDAYKESFKVAGSIGRVAALTAGGTAAGALEEIANDPSGTACKASAMIASGLAVGATAALFNPAVAAAAGATMTGLWAWENLNPYDEDNRNKYSQIGNSVQETWAKDDSAVFNKNFEAIKQCTGPIALDVGLMALTPHVVNFGARHTSNFAKDLKGNIQATKLCPVDLISVRHPLTAFSIADINFFSNRHGKVRVSKGPPETIDARLATMDEAQGINRKVDRTVEQTNHKRVEQISPKEWHDIILAPEVKVRRHLEPRSFWSESKCLYPVGH